MTDLAHWPIQNERARSASGAMGLEPMVADIVFAASLLVAAGITVGVL